MRPQMLLSEGCGSGLCVHWLALDSGLNPNPHVPLGISQGCSPSGELPRTRSGQWSGSGNGLDALLSIHVGSGGQELCRGSSSASLLPSLARQHLGGQGRELSPRERLSVPGKGARTPQPVPASTRSLALSQSPDFTGSQICHQPVHQHKPPWQSSGGFCSLPCHLALGTVGFPTRYCSQRGGWGTCQPQLQTPAL